MVNEKNRVLSFYSIIYSLIKKLLSKSNKILEIGFGQHPFFINFLNYIGYECFGIEPNYDKPDNKTTFKARFPELPEKLNKKYDLVFAVYVFSVIYDDNMKLKKDEEKINKVLSKLSDIIKQGGYLVLGDCVGTIFKRKELEKEFKILMFEKDIIINDYEKALTLTILKKK
jgi:hypothetical protein